MTVKEAQSIKWGTKLEQTRLGKSRFSEKKYQKGALFLRYNGASSITIIVCGRVTPSSWSRLFWKVSKS